MNTNNDKLITKILSICTEVTNHDISNNEITIATRPKNLISLFEHLKEDTELNFEMLIDITAVDYPQRSKRFELVYILLSLKNHLRIKVKIFLNDNSMKLISSSNANE